MRIEVSRRDWWPPTGSACLRLGFHGCIVKPATVKPQIDYCKTNNTCDQLCSNGLNRAICSCYPGYKRLGDKCEDIDECKTGADRCLPPAQCRNTIGGYECYCKHPGLVLDNFGKKCIDKNECHTNNGGCDHTCTNTMKSYKCSCDKGYTLAADGQTCTDIDECLTDNIRCDLNTSICINKPGYYKCECNSGLQIAAPTKDKQFSCGDIDECSVANGNCDHNCHNTYGSYFCSCNKNTKLDVDGKHCNDVDECQLGIDGCEQVCNNRYGTYSCSCKLGFKLDANGRNCTDINECAANGGKGDCGTNCENTIGSYKCSCDKGFVLASDRKSCTNFDECAARTDNCDSGTSKCVDTHGSFECRCNPGFKENLLTGKCEAKKCPALNFSPNGHVLPNDCLVTNAKQFKDVCTFECNDGYEANAMSAKNAYCNKDGRWDFRGLQTPLCQKVKCGPTDGVLNGQVVPSKCGTVGAQFGDSCNLYCSNGFKLKGTGKITCMADKTYDNSFDNSECIKKKKINCPTDVKLILPLGAKEMTLPLAKVDSILESDKLITEPAGVLTGDYKFTWQSKSQAVKLKYKDEFYSDDSESCTFHVTLIDREPPEVLNCPTGDFYTIIKGAKGQVSWPEPTFNDNVRVTKLIQNIPNNDLLPQQVYFVFYAAKDESGNEAVCRFFVHVKAKFCAKETMPGGTSATKTWFPSGPTSLSVFLNCPQQTTFSANITGASIFRCNAGSWLGGVVPDCVGYSVKNGQCDIGRRSVKSNGQTVCAKCPTGTKGSYETCTKCDGGYYQDDTGKTDCKICPPGTTSLIEGARKASDCQAQCYPGTYSITGLFGSNGCTKCPAGSFQDQYGQMSCKICPNGGESYEASTRVHDCTLKSRIYKIAPISETVLAKVGDTITIDCFARGSPRPLMSFTNATTLAPESFRGKRSFTHIPGTDDFEVGLRMIITGVQTYDTSVYNCIADNTKGPLGGKDVRDIYIKVNQ